MVVSFSYSAQATVANMLDKQPADNEDFVINKDGRNGYHQWVLCDGAGGSGVFCKEWAAYLGSRIPGDPAQLQQTGDEHWFRSVSSGFHDEVILQKDLSDLILQKKVYYSGSYATMSACWIDPVGREVFFSSVGDSCIFYFADGPGGLKLDYLASLDQQDHIDAAPELLNWNTQEQPSFPLHSQEVDGKFRLLMASDSLAKWIIINICLIDFSMIANRFSKAFLDSLRSEKYEERRHNIKMGSGNRTLEQLFVFLKNALIDQSSFAAVMRGLLDNGEIDPDDYSLILTEGHVS